MKIAALGHDNQDFLEISPALIYLTETRLTFQRGILPPKRGPFGLNFDDPSLCHSGRAREYACARFPTIPDALFVFSIEKLRFPAASKK
ncbi:hypothetical protein CEXT_225671 [Caerostris extrusa]|uniref:Uncharacterized protein n=1 Tax=Caerostris extrusa TaxID=172846 RepID=A0AAV4W3R8_CAEEX|nr:hypothetical protein CEXT_225671 [Caerostris extrusa]